MSLWSAALNKLLDWIFPGLPGFIMRLIFPEPKIKEGISVAQIVQESLADIYISESGPHSLKNVVVEFHNHLPFRIKVKAIEGTIRQHLDIIVEEFSKPVRLEIRPHCAATFRWSYDLPAGRGLELRRDGVTYLFDITGKMVFDAFNKELEKDVSLRIWSFIHKGP